MLQTIATTAVLCGVLAASVAGAQAPQPEYLWPNGAPGAKGDKPEDKPTITIYRAPADKATGSAVVVCPGGGYSGLAPHEGKPVAEWFNSIGVTAAVLQYRLGPTYHHPVELGDAQRAIRIVRSRAKDLGIDPLKIGILGFSAGGHLASSAVTHFDAGDANATDPIDRVSCRPDIGILIYPVITFTKPYTHEGSRNNLLGENPPEELIKLLSNEKQVTSKTPPCFLVHSVQDSVVPVENSMMFASALRRAHVPFVLHVFEKGEHGYGLGTPGAANSEWPTLCTLWLREKGWLK